MMLHLSSWLYLSPAHPTLLCFVRKKLSVIGNRRQGPLNKAGMFVKVPAQLKIFALREKEEHSLNRHRGIYLKLCSAALLRTSFLNKILIHCAIIRPGVGRREA